MYKVIEKDAPTPYTDYVQLQGNVGTSFWPLCWCRRGHVGLFFFGVGDLRIFIVLDAIYEYLRNRIPYLDPVGWIKRFWKGSLKESSSRPRIAAIRVFNELARVERMVRCQLSLVCLCSPFQKRRSNKGEPAPALLYESGMGESSIRYNMYGRRCRRIVDIKTTRVRIISFPTYSYLSIYR